MRARDLAKPYATVRTDSDAMEALRLLVEQNLPGLLVLDAVGQPYAILPSHEVVRVLVPGYVQEDPVLADVWDELHADHLGRALRGKQVADVLPLGRPFLPSVGPGATAMEIAELMVRTRSPLVAIVERPDRDSRRLLGVVTSTHLLEELLQAA